MNGDALFTIRNWIKGFPQCSELTDLFVDYTEAAPNNGGLAPTGLTEVSRTTDIFGNTTVKNQYNFTIYFVFAKAPDDSDTAENNARFIAYFQEWVQEQSATRQAPTFGDEPAKEYISAQNGMLAEADSEGTAVYTIQLSAVFYKFYEVKNEWLQ